MTRGWKVALGCGGLFVVVIAGLVALVGLRLYREWRAARLVADLREAAAALPFTPPPDGVVREDRLRAFLEVGRRMDEVERKYGKVLEAEQRVDLDHQNLGASLGAIAYLQELQAVKARALHDVGMGMREFRWIIVSLAETPWDGPFSQLPPGAVSRGASAERTNTDLFVRFEPELRRRYDMKAIRERLTAYRHAIERGAP